MEIELGKLCRDFIKIKSKGSEMKKNTAGILACMALLLFISTSWAADFPTKAMEWMAPFGPGGPSAIALKVIGDATSKTMGKPVLIVPAPGGGGTIGGARVAKAKPDGYTLLNANSATNAISLYIKKEVPYTNRDFEFLAEFGALDLGLLIKGDSPFKTIDDYIDFAKKNPSGIKQASTGSGTGGHFCLELLKLRAGGLKIDMVPFKTSAEIRTAVLGGHCHAAFIYGGAGGPGDEFKQSIEGGGRILAVASKNRLKAYPQVPTFKEKGLDVVFSAWYGIAGPKGMPKDVSDKLKEAIYRALHDPQVIQGVEGLGFRFEFRNSEEFTSFVGEFDTLVKKIVEEAKIQVE